MKHPRHIHTSTPAKTGINLVNQLVINWHFTEKCNYSCKYCYSHWNKHFRKKELFHDKESTRQLLREIKRFFSPKNKNNPLCCNLKWEDLRINLVGGEPLVYPQRTLQIAREAKDLGFKVSLITNGSGLFQSGLNPLFESLFILGISVDSINAGTCHQIGRVDKLGRIISLARLREMIEKVRDVNPEVILKINTVVSKLNSHENLAKLLNQLQPERWKVLKVLPVISNTWTISEQDFRAFIGRHRHFEPIMSIENNQAMIESYLMVDPFGRFFSNKQESKPGNSYSYSQPILTCGADVAFGEIDFDVKKFAARYPYASVEVAV